MPVAGNEFCVCFSAVDGRTMPDSVCDCCCREAATRFTQNTAATLRWITALGLVPGHVTSVSLCDRCAKKCLPFREGKQLVGGVKQLGCACQVRIAANVCCAFRARSLCFRVCVCVCVPYSMLVVRRIHGISPLNRRRGGVLMTHNQCTTCLRVRRRSWSITTW